MPRRSRPNYYAVAVGRRPGVYTHWDACRNEVEGFSGAKYKGFNDLESAHRYVEQESYYAHPQPTYPVYTSAAAAVPEDELIEVQPRRELLPSARHQDAVQIVYVDGSAPSNGQYGAVAGIGIVWGDLSTHSEALPGNVQTNNRAELYAIVRALELDPHPYWPMHLHSDSAYTIRSLLNKWPNNWRSNGWVNARNQPVANRDLIEYALALIELKMRRCNEFLLIKCQAHAGDAYNELADSLAKRGARLRPLQYRDFRQEVIGLREEIRREEEEDDAYYNDQMQAQPAYFRY